MSAGPTKAIWFRSDLRLHDNPALVEACTGATQLLPIFVFDPSRLNVSTQYGSKKSSARRCRFLLESVADLRAHLQLKGSGLAVGVGTPGEVVRRLSIGAQTVYVTQGFCSEEKASEKSVARNLEATQKLHQVWGGSLYLPYECGCNPLTAPLLFTQFKNGAERRGRIREPLPTPDRLPPLPEHDDVVSAALSFLPSLVDLGYSAAEAEEAVKDDPRGVLPFRGGESMAMERLQKWMFKDDHLKEYFEIRNGMLGEGYSSKFSPWLALGCLSPRHVWKEAQHYEKTRVANKSTYWLIFELTWRDFFIYMAHSQGRKLFLPGGPDGKIPRWTGSREALDRWKEGRTGDQLVDANMKELKATGFMSNRGRQNVASYLIFDLDVDWRLGAAHFEEHLLDYDPCSNWGNWVAAAGLTGQRVNRFNTRKQLNDYDPNREYVRHWLQSGGLNTGTMERPPCPQPSHPAQKQTKRRQRWQERSG